MKPLLIIALILFGLSHNLSGQTLSPSETDLKQEIINLRTDVDNVILNLELSQKRFKTGIFVATLGYSITIAGGLMLGRENDELGQVLLVTGGATGALGTYLLVDAFKYFGRIRNKKP